MKVTVYKGMSREEANEMSRVGDILWLQGKKAEYNAWLKDMMSTDFKEDDFTTWIVETKWRRAAGIVEERVETE